MESLFDSFDAVGFLANVVSICFLIAGWRRLPWLDVKLILGGIFAIVIAVQITYGFERMGIESAFGVLFEYIQLLLPLLWMFLIASYLQGLATERIAAKERTLYQLLEGIPIGVMVIDTKGETSFINEPARRTRGKEATTLSNAQDWFRQNPPLRAGTGKRYPREELPVVKAFQGHSAEVDDLEIVRDGLHVPVQVWSAPIFDSAGKVEFAIVAFDDITDRRATEQRVRASEALYRALAENSSAGVWHVDPDGYTIYANPAMRALLEVPNLEDLKICTYHDFFSEESLRQVLREYEERESGRALSFELEILGRKGGRAQVLITGTPVLNEDRKLSGFIGTFIDVSALTEAEATLRNEQVFFDTAMDCMPGIFFLADAQGTLIRWNRNLPTVLGIDEDGLRKGPPLRFVPENLRAVFRANLKEIFLRGAHGFESAILAADGSELRYYFTGRRFVFQDDPCIIVTAIDISEQKRAQVEREALEQQLQQAQKMESIGLLAGGVAHDFNNLLVAILGYTDLIKGALGPSHPVYAELMQIERAGEQASALTSQLLAFSRKQILQPKVFDLNSVIYETEKMLNRLLGETIAVQCRLDDDLPTIRADRGQIEQVLVNLAVNARDAMANGGVLLFSTESCTLDDRDLGIGSDLAPGVYVHLAVVDTGCGMSPEVQRKIFDPFFTTKSTGKGTGLGLSTVYGIVRQSGGDLRVDSAEGKGSAFHLYFPVCEEEDEEDLEAAGPVQSLLPANETILVTEDAEAPRELICRVLREQGFTVLSAASAAEGEGVALNYKGTIDLLLTDIVMPGESGHELADRLKSRLPDLKVMYMTGYTDSDLVKRHVSEGGVTLLQKPFTPGELLTRLRAVLSHGAKNTRA